MIDFRALFAEVGVEWHDRGKNCSRGHINVNCPFCWDDPSWHCTISEQSGWFHCYRDDSHFGSALNLIEKLLRGKGERRPRVRAAILLEEYQTDAEPEPPPVRKLGSYDAFPPAWQSPAMLDYLAERGFSDPAQAATRFNLRFAPNGLWAQRLLLPLYNEAGAIGGWTGRAIRDNLEPRYRSEPASELAALYAGSLAGDTLIVVEGPIDAAKGNAALIANGQISCVALTGLHLSAGRLNCICQRQPKRIWLALDSSVRRNNRRRIMAELARYSGERFVRHLLLPAKDFGDMPEQEISQLIQRAEADAVPMAGSVRELV